ncbi:multidrug efflux system outer membrane protein [Elusimicrobium posterum]|uniref:efflux transporter outer membrane subunit n=1 Tax=Elusimicrobium posterum TaxID=3116653 RepID=UPI003C724E9C
MKTKYLIFLCAAICFLGACLMGPNYKSPELDLSKNYSTDNFSIFTNAKWWEVFEDPVLNKLEEEALEHNKDLQAAMAAVDAARAQAGVAAADRMPSISAAGETGRAGTRYDSEQTLSTANLSASFELDLWGKYRRLSEAARANLLSSQASKDTVRLTLTADVAGNYIALITLDEQLAITRRTLETRQENYRIYNSRFINGSITEVDLRRVEADMAGVEAQEAELEKQLAKTETALAVLLGRSPREIVENNIERGRILEALILVPEVPEGIPSDLLARRPDVRQAEGMLIAANARIGVARAAFFPSIPLTGSAGFSSNPLNELFRSSSGVWAIGAVLPRLFSRAAGLFGVKEKQRQTISKCLPHMKRQFRARLKKL